MKQSILTLASLAVLAGAARADTLFVPEDYPMIQAAIIAASDGDTVLVSPGTYHENLDFLGKAITVTSRAGAAETIVDGQYPIDPSFASVVLFMSGEGPDSVLDGFTLTGGQGSQLSGSILGGGIYMGPVASPTILNNVIRDNVAVDGGGICIDGLCNPQLANNVIHDNTASHSGGGVAIGHGANPTLTNEVITRNTSTLGSGVGCTMSSMAVLVNTIVWDNQGGPQLLTGTGSVIVADYCDVQFGWPGTRNIDADPLFADPAGFDFHLADASPCIDAGYDSAPGLQVVDFERDVRISGWHVDIGADELIGSRRRQGQPFPSPWPDPRPGLPVDRLPLKADTFIDQYAPSANRGGGDILRVRNFDGHGDANNYEYDLMVEFDLRAIPPGSRIRTATVWLYYESYWDHDPAGHPLSLHRITSGWQEDVVTWNNRPSTHETATDSAVVPSSTRRWMQWDVTADVQAMVNGTLPSYGWSLQDHVVWNDYGIPITNFTPREGGAERPMLIVSYR